MRKIWILLLLVLQCNLLLVAQEVVKTNSNETAVQTTTSGNATTGQAETTEWSIFGNAGQASGTSTNQTAPQTTATAATGANATPAQQEPAEWTIFTKRPAKIVYTVKAVIPEDKWDY